LAHKGYDFEKTRQRTINNAQPLNIPISFRFLKVPFVWELRSLTSPRFGTLTRLCGEPKKIDFQSKSLSKLDGWRCREEFLSLPRTDQALVKFLNKVGMWDFHPSAPHPLQPIMIEAEQIWEFRESVGKALQDQKGFMEHVAPEFPAPKTAHDLIGRPHPSNDFRLRFEMMRVAAGVVVLTNACHMLRATVFVDIARGIRFETCQRKDCGKPFPLTSEHERKYCCQYCGHLESIRRKRREAHAAKRKKGHQD
jgi:hypothetical protein